MKSILRILVAVSTCYCALQISAQTLFVPGGLVGTSSTANVGIGTTTPSFPLTIANSGSVKLMLTGATGQNGVLFDAAGVAHQYYVCAGNNLLSAGDNGFVIFDATAGQGKFFINSSGNVGIGVASPQAGLDVSNGIHIHGGPSYAATGAGLELLKINDSLGTVSMINGPDRSERELRFYGTPIAFYQAGAERIRVASNGNVGINTATPNQKFSVAGGPMPFYSGGLSNPVMSIGTTQAADLSEALGFYTYDTVSGYQGWVGGIGIGGEGGGWGSKSFRIQVPDGSGSPLNAISIQGGSAMVGIGLSDPRWRLGVADGIEVRADDADSKLTFHDPGNVWYTMGLDYSDNRNFKLGFGGNVGDVTDFTLTPGGNLGLGTNAPQAPLDVVSSDFYMARFQGLTTSNQAILIGNASGSNYMNIGIGANTATAGVPYIWGKGGKFMIGNDGGPVFFVSGQGSSDGKIGIRTINPTHPLTVNGTIRAREVIVDNTAWSDYVFSPDYRLPALSEVEAQIKADKHLPGIPSAREVAEHGISVGEMQAKLLAKIEELTLHQIEQEKQLVAQNAQAVQLSARIKRLETENATLRAIR